MKTTTMTRFVQSPWSRADSVLATGAAFFLIALVLRADSQDDPPLKVLKMGLGSGTVTSSPAGINCGPTCEAGYASTDTVTLTATPDAGSTFAGWDIDPDADSGTTPDCSGSVATCTLSMNVARSVRPVFDLTTAIPTLASFTPEGIQTYLTANVTVNTAARFVKALPAEYKQNWILMSRSESLQTGTAEMPRILLPARTLEVFTSAWLEHFVSRRTSQCH